MVKSVYTCDICDKEVKLPENGKRLRWASRDCIELRHLHDKMASNKVVCNNCLEALVKAQRAL